MATIDMTVGDAAIQQEAFRRLRANETDSLSTLAKTFLSRLPPTISGKLSGIPVGTLPIVGFNAMTIKSPSGDPIVAIDIGMMAIISEIATAYVASMPLADSPAEMSLESIATSI